MSLSIIHVGLDVHKESITVAVLPADAPTPTRVDRLPNDLPKLQRYLARVVPEGTLRICYEASGAGFVLHRVLRSWGYHCDVIAPSLIPTKPGVQRKHDRYDATQLARLYRAGELTVVRVPTEGEERIRDLVRCRETLQRELLKSRHYLLKFLARRGLVFRAGKHWTQAHLAWLRALAGPASLLEAEDVEVLTEYLALFDYKLGRRQALDQRVAALAETPSLRTAVQWLQCFRGFQVHGAMVLQTELGDWRRFDSPRPLMAYLGLVPREDSTGPRERKGSITKAGNAHCRHVLIQAAWSYRHPPKVSAALKARQRSQPATVLTHAWKAQHRLHRLYHHLAYRKEARIAVVAVARELVGFLWAVMRQLEPAVAKQA
jgi:transposase